ncbi:hypothetical protein TeGR_g4862 [Tetraparma gracilis]|uniref:UNC-45/Cro1/She4 central domain-containing protein n=1 Tax=Tetraparma gracilis TaxID=2962635 RepID=A0ABQ6M7X3_9STRA|nr:hypothetical protein TeGR_g4862 [Tetraparma gracilis]
MFDADLLTLNGPSRDPHKLAALTSLHASLLSSSRAPLLDLIPARRLFDSAGLFRTLSRCLSSCPEPKRVFESASPERDLLAIGCLSAFLRCPEFLLVLSKGWEAQTDSGRSLSATQKDVVNETLLAAFFRTILPDPAPAFVERVLRGGTEEAAVATAAYSEMLDAVSMPAFTSFRLHYALPISEFALRALSAYATEGPERDVHLNSVNLLLSAASTPGAAAKLEPAFKLEIADAVAGLAERSDDPALRTGSFDVVMHLLTSGGGVSWAFGSDELLSSVLDVRAGCEREARAKLVCLVHLCARPEGVALLAQQPGALADLCALAADKDAPTSLLALHTLSRLTKHKALARMLLGVPGFLSNISARAGADLEDVIKGANFACGLDGEIKAPASKLEVLLARQSADYVNDMLAAVSLASKILLIVTAQMEEVNKKIKKRGVVAR